MILENLPHIIFDGGSNTVNVQISRGICLMNEWIWSSVSCLTGYIGTSVQTSLVAIRSNIKAGVNPIGPKSTVALFILPALIRRPKINVIAVKRAGNGEAKDFIYIL